jgi:hypothetical protein
VTKGDTRADRDLENALSRMRVFALVIEGAERLAASSRELALLLRITLAQQGQQGTRSRD